MYASAHSIHSVPPRSLQVHMLQLRRQIRRCWLGCCCIHKSMLHVQADLQCKMLTTLCSGCVKSCYQRCGKVCNYTWAAACAHSGHSYCMYAFIQYIQLGSKGKSNDPLLQEVMVWGDSTRHTVLWSSVMTIADQQQVGITGDEDFVHNSVRQMEICFAQSRVVKEPLWLSNRIFCSLKGPRGAFLAVYICYELFIESITARLLAIVCLSIQPTQPQSYQTKCGCWCSNLTKRSHKTCWSAMNQSQGLLITRSLINSNQANPSASLCQKLAASGYPGCGRQCMSSTEDPRKMLP